MTNIRYGCKTTAQTINQWMPPAKNKVDNCSRKSFYFQKKNQFKVLKNIWNVEKLLIIDHKLQHPSKALIYLKLMSKNLFFFHKNFTLTRKIILKHWKTFDNWSQVASEALKWRTYVVVVGKFQIWK